MAEVNFHKEEQTVPLHMLLDLAYRYYDEENGFEEKIRQDALAFLKYGLDVETEAEVKTLMLDRLTHADEDPYIPGKKPSHLKAAAPQADDVREVVQESKLKDLIFRTKMFTDKQRAEKRVLIHQGKFKQRGELFSTAGMTSKKKADYAAYTLNLDGELSVFSHLYGREVEEGRRPVYHSSMNAGAKVACAGELKIKNGELKEINVHSGHYQPTLYHLMWTLHHFQNRGVDLKHTDVLVDQACRPALLAIGLHPHNMRSSGPDKLAKIKATDLLKAMDKQFTKDMAALAKKFKTYNRKGVRFYFHHSVGLMMGKTETLTAARRKLAVHTQNRLEELTQEFKQQSQNVTGEAYTKLIKSYRDQVKGLVDAMIEGNRKLSVKHGKSQESGRLERLFKKTDTQMEDVKSSAEKYIQTFKDTY